MSLADVMAADMAAIVTAEEFGEAITYAPHGESPVSFAAQVFRDPMHVVGYGEGLYGQEVIEVAFPNHATLGRTAVTLDRDTITAKLRLADAEPRCFRVCKIISQDAGAWHVLAKA